MFVEGGIYFSVQVVVVPFSIFKVDLGIKYLKASAIRFVTLRVEVLFSSSYAMFTLGQNMIRLIGNETFFSPSYLKRSHQAVHIARIMIETCLF